MTVTLTWQTILLPILAVAGIVAVIYLCIVLANLVTTLKKLNSVLDDAKELTEFVTEQKDKANNVIDGVGASVANIVSNLKANKNTIKSVSSIVGATTSIIGVARSANKKKAAKAEKAAEKEAKKEKKKAKNK